MKKMLSKLTALTAAVLLMFSLCLSVAAEEYSLAAAESLFNKSLASECGKDGSDVTTVLPGTDESANAGKPVGIFALRLGLGATAESMGAYLVQNGGAKYILTHSVAAAYAAEGIDLTLMGMDGENHTAYCVGVIPEYELAFLIADGMEGYEPLKFSREPFSTAVTVGLAFSNSNYTAARMIEYRSYDMGRFTQLSDLYYGEMDREVTLQWLGSPILRAKDSQEVQGICSAVVSQSGEMYMAIITFEKLKLEPTMALGVATVQQQPAGDSEPAQSETPKPTEPAPQPEPESKGVDPKLLVIGGLVVAAIAYYLYNNNKKKEQEKKQEAAVVDVTQPKTPMAGFDATRPMSDWVLRCTGGPLNGQTFPLSGRVMIGRSASAGIAFPDNTPGVSGKHCEIAVSGDSVVLLDANSTYGTFVSGGKLSPGVEHPLKSGDTFTLAQGGPSFRLERAGGQQVSLAVRAVDGRVFRADSSGRLTFGRNSSNAVQIADAESAVSGNHCVLYFEGGKLYLKDLESTNGTFFNENERLKPGTAYRVNRGTSFFLVRSANTFTIIEG